MMTTTYPAEETLDRMAEIVRAEMMARMLYVGALVRPDLAEQGAVCGGRRHCAVGALWVAHGIPYITYEENVDLPDVEQSRRLDFLAEHAELALAHDALGEAADAFAEGIGMQPLTLDDRGYGGPSYVYGDDGGYASVSKIEALFEGRHRLSKEELLGVVLDARERVPALREARS